MASLARVGLAEFVDAYPGELSGGMRQRLAVARALALDADLLLMDEPLSALDALTREDLQDLLLELWRQRQHTCVLVTHSIEEAVFLGRRVIVLSPQARDGWPRSSTTRGWGSRAIGPHPSSTSAASSCVVCLPRKARSAGSSTTPPGSSGPVRACERVAAQGRRLRRCGDRGPGGVAAGAWALDSRALPGPVPALTAFFTAFWSDLAPHLAVSTWRVVAATALGTVLAVPLGLWLGRSQRADAVAAPVIFLTYPIPKVVFLPVLLVILGLGDASKIVLITLIVFFQLLVTARDAARAIPAGSVLSVRSLGAGELDVFRHVVVPAALPDIFTALRIGTGTAVAVLFLAESIGGHDGAGLLHRGCVGPSGLRCDVRRHPRHGAARSGHL
jgi:ABC-type nitrate/sulfonate/bicarbonate transport system permease component